MKHRLASLLLCAAAPGVFAASPVREPVSFRYTWDVGVGRSVFVVGSHDDVGDWSPGAAVKLYWTAGNVWTGQVAVQASTALEYKFIARTNSAAQYCNGDNVEWMAGTNWPAQVAAQPAAPYTGKTILYHSGWTNAGLVYRVGTNWYGTAMERLGAGRSGGEYLYRASGFGVEGEPIEFVPYGYFNSTQYWDHAPYGGYGDSNYYTTLDVLFLQDGNIFGYRPPASVSAPRIALTNVNSSFPGIAGRTVRVYLPRGYDQNAWKRYPVLYLHDGQNVFAPGGDFGSWDCDLTATREISQGRMREAILVGMDNTAARLTEYCPPGDDAGYGAGIADQYANFVIHNVRPTVDTHYRTLNDKANTLTLGSSMGGLVSAYFGFETNAFGKIGVVSPSFWAADNFAGRINSNDVHGIRVYMDWGTGEGSSMWSDPWNVYDDLLRDGYAPGNDLRLVIGCGAGHNEPAWAARVPGMYHFLLNLWDEPNLLAQEEYPPVLGFAMAGSFTVDFTALRGRAYQLNRSLNLAAGPWSNVAALAEEPLPWSPRTITDTNPPAASGPVFYRVSADAWPP